MKALREPLWWLIALFIGLLAGCPTARRCSVGCSRNCRGRSTSRRASGRSLDHGWLVVASSLAATAIGLGAGVAVTRPRGSVSSAGGDHRRYRADLSAGGGAGDGGAGAGLWLPALIALALYGILPVLQGTLAGLGSIPPGCQAWLKGWE